MVLLSLGLGSSALAGYLSAEERSSLYKSREVQGRVVNAKEVKFKGTDKKNLVVLMRTSKGHEELIVDLGDFERIKGIKKGKTKIKVEGRMVKVGEKEFLLARRIEYGDRLIKVNRKNYFRRSESKRQSL